MIYQELKPSAQLQSIVKCYWTLEKSSFSPISMTKEKVFPDGCPEIIFHYGDQFTKHAKGEHSCQPKAFLHGQIKEYIEISSTGKIGVFGVRLYPWALGTLTDIPIYELTNHELGLRTLWPHDANTLIDRIMLSSCQYQRARHVESFILDRLKHSRKIDPCITNGVLLIQRSKGLIKTEDLAEKSNLSARQLERRFRTAVGLGPKSFANIVRFQNVLKLAEQGFSGNLTNVAYQAGYFDQSHFIKDFKRFSGTNPGKYFSSEHGISDYFF